MYLIKNQQVKSVKQEIMTEKERYANDLAVQYEQITERKQEIHTQREIAKNAVQNFKWSRVSEKQNEFKIKTQNEKRLIQQYQEEASELERLEAELLSRL
jgi:D-mannonate dehydratase